MSLYGVTILLSAFLLFLVQPLIGKYILPWFGGTPAVWTACMLFFQGCLLGGYLYAHLLTQRIALRRQLLLHALLLAASLLALPIFPADAWKPSGEQWPLPRILGLLLASIGTPYLLLSATSPLLQSWFSREHPGQTPYRLYSLSNLGSLLAILAYPFLIEPSLSLSRQILSWSWAYALLVALGAGLTWRLNRSGILQAERAGPPPESAARPSDGIIPRAPDRALWFSLSACGSMALLSTTNQLCLDVAVVPLLWILPLALYLLTFVICFQHERWYSRLFFGPALAAALVQTCVVLYGGVFVGLKTQIASYSCTLFVCCMICHGELVRLKPHPRHLTSYYLAIAGGGAIGGLLVSVAAPLAFRGFWEYHLALCLTPLLFLILLFRDPRSPLCGGAPAWAWTPLYAAFLGLGIALVLQISETLQGSIATTRNFFGVLRVLDEDKENPQQHRRTLMHGRIEHGFQFYDPERQHWPTSYFGPDGGAGLSILAHPRRRGGDGRARMRIGVVGLGVGTIAAYGEQGDYIRFYEINPAVLRFSDRYFSYRKDSPAQIEVVLGDARISMERERQSGTPGGFDVLIIDAFSSDAIPVHLLTRECFLLYLYHLKSDGILAVHISNRYFDLSPVVRAITGLAPACDMTALSIAGDENDLQGVDATHYILLSRNPGFLQSPEVQRATEPWPDDVAALAPWSDDYSNLFRLLKH